MDKIRGEYGDDGMDMLCVGDPRPNIPETLFLLLLRTLMVGLTGRLGPPCLERFVEELE